MMHGYTNLQSEAEPEPMLRGPLAPVLGLLLRLANVLLGAGGALLLGLAFYLDWRYNHSTDGGSGGVDSPPPPALAAGLAAEAAVASFPWFLYMMGAVGAYVLGAAFVGWTGVSQASRWRLLLYIGLLSGLVLGQATTLLLLFTENRWKEGIPGDPSGCWEAAQRYIEKHSSLIKVASLGLMAAELLAIAAASWLHTLLQSAYEAWLDDREEAEARAREALQAAVQRQYQGGSSLWTQRMMQKYGVNQSQVQREAAAVRQVAALSGDIPPPVS